MFIFLPLSSPSFGCRSQFIKRGKELNPIEFWDRLLVLKKIKKINQNFKKLMNIQKKLDKLLKIILDQ